MTQKHVISFRMGYLSFLDFKATMTESKIDWYNMLNDDLIIQKQKILQIKENAGDDGLSRDDRIDIRYYRDGIDDTRDAIDELPDIALMQHRLERLTNKIDHYADLWGIDSW